MRTKDDNKRIAIYHAAMDVVNENGVDNASMSIIAKTAGVSSSTIYVYFKNKADMINKLYLMAKQESSLAMFNDLNKDMSVEEAMKSWMRNFYQYLIQHPAELSFLEQFHASPTITEKTRKEGLKYFSPVIDIQLQAVHAKIIKNLPPPLIRAFTFDPIMSLAKTHLQNEYFIDADVLEKAIELSWISIKK
jgi:AcrR family transcriptional regulator